MIGRADGSRLAQESAFLLAEADPLLAARTLARGLRNQPNGGKVAVIRSLAQQLAERDPALLREIAAEMARLVGEHP